MRLLFVAAGVMALAFVAVPLWWLFLGAMHWALFGLVIWGAMCLLRGPRSRERRQRVAWSSPPRPMPQARPPRAPQPARTASPPASPPMAGSLPLDVEVKVEQIRRKVEVLLQQRDRFPFGSEDLHIIRATRDDYLPRTLDAYMSVPPDSRERSMPSGKTPLQELKEQLSLLDTKLDEVAEDLERRNFDRLLANRRFLEHRFGREAAALR
ncbi:MAG TPA: hypothetical protein VMW62_04315 [Chloroflexota bacterium]|nr:hypothetical protein [Chloroflexota bacterium]